MSAVMLAVAFLVVLLFSVRVAKEGERVAIMRLGQFIGVRGPGVVWVLPFLDRITRVNLDRDIPNWRTLSPEQLAGEVARRLLTSGLPGE